MESKTSIVRFIRLMATAILLASLFLLNESAAEDATWPRTYQNGDIQVILQAPQVDDWKNYAVINFRCVVTVAKGQNATPAYGVVAATANTKVSVEQRTVLLTNMELEVRFLAADDAEKTQLERIVREALPKETSFEVSLDRLFAHVASSEKQRREVEVNLDPPKILYSDRAAILVIFAGEPLYKPVVPNSKLMFAVNTNWDLFFASDAGQYYLLDGDSWLQTADVAKGPWKSAQKLPGELMQLPADANWEEVRKNLPPAPSGRPAPLVFVSNEPAELVLTDGAPEYSPIGGTRLMYVTNTQSPLFLHSGSQQHYYLVAGRWFRAKSLQGPWESASKDLPPDFAQIPEIHPAAYILPSVPGTEQARDAVLLASIPQKATVSRTDLTITVAYDAQPKFVPIQGTEVQYATNTSYSVFWVNSRYYCCHQGVWFEAAGALGPWAVCTVVPQAIYTIPPTHPLHNVTYVYVYDSTPQTVVVGTTSGYSGEFVTATGVVMFGAGVLVGALLDDDDDYYHYHVGYGSYGCGARYSYASGGYYRGAQAYGPYGGAGRYAAYNPASGTYSRGAYRYGPSGGAFAQQAYNPWTNTYAARAGGTNGYQSWSRGVVARDDDWVAGGRQSGPRGTTGWVETSQGNAAVGAKGQGGGKLVGTSEGNIYAGKDGNVYKRDESGSWQKYQRGGDWDNVSRPTGSQAGATPRQFDSDVERRLNSDNRARQTGAQREVQTRQSRATQNRSAPSRGSSGGRRR